MSSGQTLCIAQIETVGNPSSTVARVLAAMRSARDREGHAQIDLPGVMSRKKQVAPKLLAAL